MDHPESNGANPGSIGACVVELWGGYIFGGGPVCSFATVYGTRLKFHFRITPRPYVRSIQGLHQCYQRQIIHHIDPLCGRQYLFFR